MLFKKWVLFGGIHEALRHIYFFIPFRHFNLLIGFGGADEGSGQQTQPFNKRPKRFFYSYIRDPDLRILPYTAQRTLRRSALEQNEQQHFIFSLYQ
jgi:hypothetical protein